MYEARVDFVRASRYKAASDRCVVDVDLSKEAGDNTTTPLPLLLASLGSCIAVYLERYLAGAKIAFQSFSIDIASELTKEPPRFLKDIGVTITLSGASLDERRRKALLEFVKNCPAHNTFLNQPRIAIELEAQNG